ncbi:MAG: hypothetical protein HUU11_00295 [Anaerolineales bacterium]|nr:hypothetical protein [Anaerolineales bacterium]
MNAGAVLQFVITISRDLLSFDPIGVLTAIGGFLGSERRVVTAGNLIWDHRRLGGFGNLYGWDDFNPVYRITRININPMDHAVMTGVESIIDTGDRQITRVSFIKFGQHPGI